MENASEYLDNLRHSCAHLLAASVLELYPDTKPAIGPPIDNGFYYDFDFTTPISEKDLSAIEKKMHEIVTRWDSFSRHEVSKEQAEEEFSNNTYKQELIKEFSSEKKQLTIFQSGNYKDLCRGGHIDHPKKELKHFKLLSIAGAYWRGDEKNKMLTRIYGTCFPTKKESDHYLWQIEEAKKRDHRKLGKELDLFLISDQIGGGLPLFTQKGTILRRIIEQYLITTKEKAGYQFVWTTHIAHSNIYHTSGHWGKYDAMFNPMKIDDQEYVLKPMNCPHHFQIYLNKPKSYRDLPMRIAEDGTVYRQEKSGELSGLLRVRSITIDDTHTFIRYGQTFEELVKVLSIIQHILKTFGFSDYTARISVRDLKTPNKYLGKPEEWERAENALKRAAKYMQFTNIVIGKGEAAFYGPKIDLIIKDSLGREWQLSTVQLDYQQPHNFYMTYVDEQGIETYPAVLHIAMLGSIERFMAILIEHYAGAFPLWLSPVQVAILPLSDKFYDYAQKIYTQLVKNNIRASLNMDNKTLGAKIREETLQKTPYMIIIGEKELEQSNLKKRESDNIVISVRTREGKNKNMLYLYEFIGELKEKIEKRL